MTVANPDTSGGNLGDPATDRPLTVRVQGGQDRHTRLFDREATRVVKAADSDDYPWCVITGPDVGGWLTDDEVRDWTVVPAPFVSTPWADNPNHGPTLTDELRARHERGDMDVDSFKGGPA